MEIVQKSQLSSPSRPASGHGFCKTEGFVSDQFSIGLRVLLVDDDLICLRILEQMLRMCSYHVTTCCRATVALNILRERKVGFDLVISDVHMPDMDGFKLLEHVALEMDLPVILISVDGGTSAVMRGIKLGACDYLIKPVRLEELKNIWQHAIRKKWNRSKELEQSGSMEDSNWHKRGDVEAEYASSVYEGTHVIQKVQKKDAIEEDNGKLEGGGDHSTSKKPRIVWSVELHQQFVSAVNQLGIEKAVPTRILELMNVPGLTTENVASHLQKFKLQLKGLSGVESNVKLGQPGRKDVHELAASDQIPPQILATLHPEVLGQPTSSLVSPAMDKSVLLQTSLQRAKCIPGEHGVAYGQSNLSKQLFPQLNVSVRDIPSGFGTQVPNNLGSMGSMGNHGNFSIQNNGMLLQQMLQKQQSQSVVPGYSHTINMQPSCLVASSQAGNISIPLNQNPSFSSGANMIGCGLLPLSQPNNVSEGMRQVSDMDSKNGSEFNGYLIPSSISPSVSSSCSVRPHNGKLRQVKNPTINVSAFYAIILCLAMLNLYIILGLFMLFY